MNLTLDSSVIVAALREQEKYFKKAQHILKEVKDGNHTAICSNINLVEVTAAIKRRTGSTELAQQVKNDLLHVPNLHFLGLNATRRDEAAVLASYCGLRGMDAIIVQISRENGTKLVTLDKEMQKKARSETTVIPVTEL
jgi:predicted nucleic acid-binding protein